ncbi:hypothetical protein [Haladaptatus litoreus]|uniref:hypothetical protein n=1 Tax=Haladaptatus litoreus TaxID=553468 RepID=UPI001FE473FB|nr:hypothetical protein [Haladaptatus litoreus]
METRETLEEDHFDFIPVSDKPTRPLCVQITSFLWEPSDSINKIRFYPLSMFGGGLLAIDFSALGASLFELVFSDFTEISWKLILDIVEPIDISLKSLHRLLQTMNLSDITLMDSLALIFFLFVTTEIT